MCACVCAGARLCACECCVLSHSFTLFIVSVTVSMDVTWYSVFPMIILMVVKFICMTVDLGDLGVTCTPRDPRFAGSNPTEVDGFCQDVKILSTSHPRGTLSWGSRSKI